MTRRSRDLVFAAALVVLLVLHAIGKARAGLLPEMLWACHVASLLTAVGLLARSQVLLAIGFLFHLAIGTPALALELIATHETTVTSAGLHVLTPIAAFLALDALPRNAILGTWLFYLAMQVAGWLAPESLNVNVAHKSWAFLPWAVGPNVSRALNAAGALLFMIGAFSLARRFFERPAAQPSSPA